MRFFGTETEYGIACPSDYLKSPIVTSTHTVVAFSSTQPCATGARWDFGAEHPLRDMRGYDLKRYQVIPVVDPNAMGLANVVLSNGGRFYVDHAHPEYSAPETTNAWDAMVYDVAGDVVLRTALHTLKDLGAEGISIVDNNEPCPELKIYKNNVDGQGASYGSHENYFYLRSTDFQELAQALIPFFVCRQVLVGAGRVGRGQRSEEAGFQISQRADYIEQEISLETTLNRGIINTRDEPHARAEDFGRLHVIIGDANMSQVSTLLKLGMTGLVLDAIEAGVDFSDLSLARAVEEVKAVSYDLELSHKLELKDGRELTAIEILREYYARVERFATTEPTRLVLKYWTMCMDLLESQGPAGCAHLLDWCAKYRLVQSFVDRGLDIDDYKIKLIDLQYSDIDPDRGLYHALVRKERMVTLVDEDTVAEAAWNPPSDSRAYFRGLASRYLASHIAAINWESVVLSLDPEQAEAAGLSAYLEDLPQYRRASQHDRFVKIDMPTLDTLTKKSLGEDSESYLREHFGSEDKVDYHFPGVRKAVLPYPAPPANDEALAKFLKQVFSS